MEPDPMDTPDNRRRPFYAEYAWAFDLLIDRPVRKECATIVTWLMERGIRPGARLLDAGCGTGRYAAELGRRGFVVDGIDLSAELIAEATRAVDGPGRSISFAVGDISTLPAARYDGILCRGVLNDVLDGDSRRAIFTAFGTALRPGGVIVLDVREWKTTAERKIREPVFKKSVATNRGTLTFASVTEIDPVDRRLVVTERHTLTDGGTERTSDYLFVMRCWTVEELTSSLDAGGFRAAALLRRV